MRYLHDLLPSFDHSLEFGILESAAALDPNHRNHASAASQSEAAHESEIAAAFEQGRQQAVLELQAQHEMQMETLLTAEQSKLEEMVKAFELAKAKEFASLLTTTLSDLEQKLDGLLFTLVSPFIKKLVPALAMKELEALAKGALSENVTYKLDVNGPQVLLDGIRESLSSLKIEVVTEATDKLEVQIRCDEFLLTTRIQDWLNKIDGKIDR